MSKNIVYLDDNYNPVEKSKSTIIKYYTNKGRIIFAVRKSLETEK